MTKQFKTLRSITGGLQRGDFRKIAVKTGYDRSYVSRVLKGQRAFNLDILNEASNLVLERNPKVLLNETIEVVVETTPTLV